jgi:hypothetical protein
MATEKYGDLQIDDYSINDTGDIYEILKEDKNELIRINRSLPETTEFD